MIQAARLGLVQGTKGFRPLSSNAYLVLIALVLHWQGGLLDSLGSDVALPVGTPVFALSAAIVGCVWLSR